MRIAASSFVFTDFVPLTDFKAGSKLMTGTAVIASRF
jgi:hypothetical protein